MLILSEMAGAARELGEALLIINPTIPAEITTRSRPRSRCPARNRPRAIAPPRSVCGDTTWSAGRGTSWRSSRPFAGEQARFDARVMGESGREDLARRFQRAQRRLLFFDYDGTLVPFSPLPEGAAPKAELLATMRKLAASPRTEVVIISGRPRHVLEEWFAGVPVSLIAEHGAWIRRGQNAAWKVTKSLRSDWKATLLPFMKMSADRLPGAFVEEKEYSLVWHYRRADPELASVREKELTDSLVQMTANMDLSVVTGHRIVEVKNAGVSKGNAALQILTDEYDFVLAVGDDTTDEDLFRALPESAFSIRVGLTGTHARFNLPGQAEVTLLIDRLAELAEAPAQGSLSPEPASRRR